jgi:hypothetical protein
MEQLAINGKTLDRETGNKLSFIAFIIQEFASTYQMSIPEAYQYLKKYKGLDYIYDCWWALHTDNPIYALYDTFEVCHNNGGFK